MTWEKTVMSDEGILDVYSESFPHKATVMFTDREIAKHQAEITGPIAFKAGMLEESTQAYSAGKYEGKKIGMRKVVEWIEKFGGLTNKLEGEDPEYGYQVQYFSCIDGLSEKVYGELGTYYRFEIEVSRKDWKAQKKDWGIDKKA